MPYRCSYEECRNRYLKNYDAEGAARYDSWIESLTDEDFQATLTDLEASVTLRPGQRVLDAGAGTGALCLSLVKVDGLDIVALEPSEHMLARLRSKPLLKDVSITQGFCDHLSDASSFENATFDVIASKQLVNCLYDPLAAFQNWHRWLRPGGQVLVTDGFYSQADWGDEWELLGAHLPLAGCASPLTVGYLLEAAGFESIEFGSMDATNAQPMTRTKRFLVVARKPSSPGR